MIDSMNLPDPRPLLPSLLEAGLSRELATAASKLYQQRAEELKQRTEVMLTAAWKKMAELPGTSVSSLDLLAEKDLSAFTEVYLRYLEEWKEEMVQLLSRVPFKGASPSRISRPFNHEYLPLLEHFFKESPFPTHTDKVFLAKKSNMQYRQIHVWFQNRRNRTKEAKPVKRVSRSEGTLKPLDRLCKRVKNHAVKPVSKSPTLLTCVDDQNNALKCIFISPPPPHAFPASYPPTCAYDPFPCKSGLISFGKPEWKRVPCSKPPVSVFTSIDDLVGKFSQLNVRGDNRIKVSPQSFAATAAITVIPSRAPHPSLMVHKHADCAHDMLNHYPTTLVATPQLHAFQGLGSTSKPITQTLFSEPSHKREPSKKQKTVRWPQRFPTGMQDAERDTSKPSTTNPSRVLSMGSDSRSCSLSVSSPSSPANTIPLQDLSGSLSSSPPIP